jgi:hypothetical protein
MTQVQSTMVTEKNFKEILSSSKLDEFTFKEGKLEQLCRTVRDKNMVLKSRSLHGSLTPQTTANYYETPLESNMQLPANHELLDAVTIRQPRMQQLDILRAVNCVTSDSITEFVPHFEY